MPVAQPCVTELYRASRQHRQLPAPLVLKVQSLFLQSFAVTLMMTATSFWSGSSHITSETKQESMHWQRRASPCKTKLKKTLSAWKVMRTIFWDRLGIFLVDFLTRGETVNAESYWETVQKLPDLAPNDFHFLLLRKFLSCQRKRFQNDRRR